MDCLFSLVTVGGQRKASSIVHRRSGRVGCADPMQEFGRDALEEIGRMSEPERGELACRSQDRARSMFGVEAMAGVLGVSLVEAVEMGPVRAPISLKEIGFVLEFVLGLVLATLFKV